MNTFPKNSFSLWEGHSRLKPVSVTSTLPNSNKLKSEHYIGKKPRISPDKESSHAILASGTCRSGSCHLPWELSKPETVPFQPQTSQNPPNPYSDRRLLCGKIVWAIASSRRERPSSSQKKTNQSSEEGRILF